MYTGNCPGSASCRQDLKIPLCGPRGRDPRGPLQTEQAYSWYIYSEGGGKNNNNKMSSFGPSSCHSSVAVINHTTIEYLIKLSFIKSIQMEQENSGAGKHNRIKQMRKDNRTKETQGINAQRK